MFGDYFDNEFYRTRKFGVMITEEVMAELFINTLILIENK